MYLSQSVIDPAAVHLLPQRFHLAHLHQRPDLLGHDHARLIIERVLLQPLLYLLVLAVVVVQEVLAEF